MNLRACRECVYGPAPCARGNYRYRVSPPEPPSDDDDEPGAGRRPMPGDVTWHTIMPDVDGSGNRWQLLHFTCSTFGDDTRKRDVRTDDPKY